MRTNVAAPRITNHEGAPALKLDPMDRLRRTVLACMLWEDGFYEDGATIADRIKELVPQCKPYEVAELAIEMRKKHHLRHAPLLLVRELARYPSRFGVSKVLEEVIQRADELTEFLSIYWADGRKPLAKQVKLGLAAAFRKFDEYQLAKYNHLDRAVKLRDVLFLSHAKPIGPAQADLWKRLIANELKTPDTWEVALSAGEDKRAAFTRLLEQGLLGQLAILRNLRNMEQAGVDRELVQARLQSGAHRSNVLPFRYIAAAAACPQWEPMIDAAMLTSLAGMDKLPGRTGVLIDVSPSMDYKISSKSDLTRRDAAAALAILLRGICEDVSVFAFSNEVGVVPPRQGMALKDAIYGAVQSNGTRLGHAVKAVARTNPVMDRLIVFTDEESQDPVGSPHCRGYMVNVATTENAVGYGDWTRITGFSEAVISYIAQLEQFDRKEAAAVIEG